MTSNPRTLRSVSARAVARSWRAPTPQRPCAPLAVSAICDTPQRVAAGLRVHEAVASARVNALYPKMTTENLFISMADTGPRAALCSKSYVSTPSKQTRGNFPQAPKPLPRARTRRPVLRPHPRRTALPDEPTDAQRPGGHAGERLRLQGLDGLKCEFTEEELAQPPSNAVRSTARRKSGTVAVCRIPPLSRTKTPACT